MGKGFPIGSSTKQKLNTRSSTESELVGVDDMMPIVIRCLESVLPDGSGMWGNSESLVTRQQELHSVEKKW